MTLSPKMTGYIRDEMGGMARRKRDGDWVCYFEICDDIPPVLFVFWRGTTRRGAARGAHIGVTLRRSSAMVGVRDSGQQLVAHDDPVNDRIDAAWPQAFGEHGAGCLGLVCGANQHFLCAK
mgnify:CR=1 FL=1